MDAIDDVLTLAADHAARFHGTLEDRQVHARASVGELVDALGGHLPDEGAADGQVLAELVTAAEPGLVGSQTGRYFGFVFGSALPAAVAADWLATAWDQNAFSVVTSPAAAAVEEVAGGWVAELLGLPEGVSSGFVTGAQGANTTALAAARHHVLAAAGWDVERDGLTGAPPISVVAGGERHVTIDRSLRLLGLGTAAVELVPADGQGRMRADVLEQALAGRTGPTIVCAQAGNVNTGACDPLAADRRRVRRRRRLAARRRRLRPLGRRQPALSPPRRRRRARRLLGDRRPQVAQRPVRLRARLHAASRGARRGDGRRSQLPPAKRRPQPVRLGAGVVAPGTRLRRSGPPCARSGGSGVTDLVERCCDHARAFAELLAPSRTSRS